MHKYFDRINSIAKLCDIDRRLQNNSVSLANLRAISEEYKIGISEPFNISYKVSEFVYYDNRIKKIFSIETIDYICNILQNQTIAFFAPGINSHHLTLDIENIWSSNIIDCAKDITHDINADLLILQKRPLSLLDYSSAILNSPLNSVKSIDELILLRRTIYKPEKANHTGLTIRSFNIDQFGRKAEPVRIEEFVLRTLFSSHQIFSREISGSENEENIQPGLIAKILNTLINTEIIKIHKSSSHLISITPKGREGLRNNHELIEHFQEILNAFANIKESDLIEMHCDKTDDWMKILNRHFCADIILYLSYLDTELKGDITKNWDIEDNIIEINPCHGFGFDGPRKWDRNCSNTHFFYSTLNVYNKDIFSAEPALDLNNLLQVNFRKQQHDFNIINLIFKAIANF